MAGLLWERQFEKVLLEHGWEKVPNLECLIVNRETRLFLSVRVDDIKLAGKKQNIVPPWKILMKDVHLGEPTSLLDHVYLFCTRRKCQINKHLDNERKMFESKISAGALEKLLFFENNLARTFLHGLEIFKVIQRNAWNGIAKQRKNTETLKKAQLHALTTTNSRKMTRDQLDNCQKFAHKLF